MALDFFGAVKRVLPKRVSNDGAVVVMLLLVAIIDDQLLGRKDARTRQQAGAGVLRFVVES